MAHDCGVMVCGLICLFRAESLSANRSTGTETGRNLSEGSTVARTMRCPGERRGPLRRLVAAEQFQSSASRAAGASERRNKASVRKNRLLLKRAPKETDRDEETQTWTEYPGSSSENTLSQCLNTHTLPVKKCRGKV